MFGQKAFSSLAAASLLVVSGCANRPESIHAEYVSHERFAGLSCQELATRLGEAQARLQAASRRQDNAANADAATVFLVAIPVSKLAGDHEAEVAHLKGEVEAIETAQVRGKCRAA